MPRLSASSAFSSINPRLYTQQAAAVAHWKFKSPKTTRQLFRALAAFQNPLTVAPRVGKNGPLLAHSPFSRLFSGGPLSMQIRPPVHLRITFGRGGGGGTLEKQQQQPTMFFGFSPGAIRWIWKCIGERGYKNIAWIRAGERKKLGV